MAGWTSSVEAAVFGFATTFGTCVLLIATRSWHGRFTLDWTHGAQKLHAVAAPRVGALPLITGALAGALALPAGARGLWLILLIATLPAIAAGLAEDISNRISASARLTATLASGLAFVLLSGLVIGAPGLPGADALLALPLFAVFFTAFALGGMANAMNIIDGCHGLAAGTAVILLTGFAVTAHLAGDRDLGAIAGLAAALTAGFLLLNYPFGRVFLGDGGAYFLGLILAGLAIALPARNPEVPPLIGLLALAYPVTETLVSILRRLWSKGASPARADGLHLHSLLCRQVAEPLARRLGYPGLGNPLTTALLLPLPLFSTLGMIGAMFWPEVLPVALGLTVWAYLRLYRKLYQRHSGASPAPRDLAIRQTRG